VTTPARWAVVTGASRGIGAAIARRLATDGYAVALLSSNRDRLEGVAAEVRSGGGQAEVYVCDLADRQSLEEVTRELLLRHPAIAALVNNAGIVRVGSPSEQGGANWDAVMEVNLRACFELIRRLEPALRGAEDGASVVNISSVMGILSTPGVLSYVTAKGGLQHLTHGLAVEYGPLNIRVNAVAPGFIRTDMFEASHPPERQAALAAAHPLGRVGTPEEVAAVVSFLCSADASFVSGAILPVDGALSCKMAIPSIV
jgi:NAD(P)-dependent dehydrogenase (short-subunit alcohol dehydrogenase family)